MKKFNLDRETIVGEAIVRCLSEMYAKAQPSADYKKLLKMKEKGEIEDSNDNPIYKRHYLSQEEAVYIVNKYIEAYGFDGKKDWEYHIERLSDWLSDGDWGSPKHILADAINNELQNEPVSKKITDSILSLIEKFKAEKTRTTVEEQTFSFNVWLGCSPTSNKQSVIDYWKEQGVDIKIEDRCPDWFWGIDEYGRKEFELVMKDEYGKDWKEITWQKYRESLIPKDKVEE